MGGVCDVVLKDCWYVFLWDPGVSSVSVVCLRYDAYLWKVSLAVADEQTRLSASAVAYDNNLLGVSRPLGHGCCC